MIYNNFIDAVHLQGPWSPFSLITIPFAQTAPTGNNRQIGERQTEGHARHEAERLDPSRYDDDDQNVRDENVGIELDGVGYDAVDLSLMGLDCNRTPEREPDLLSHRLKH